MTGAPLIEARNLRRTYKIPRGFGRRPRFVNALNGVSFSVKQGSVLGIVGESGCGKSTLARIMIGLDKPTSGQILFEGRELDGMTRVERAGRIQPIFQDPYFSLNPYKTISSIISLPLRIRERLGGRELKKRVSEIMELTGLPSRFGSAYPVQLSGGQRQRVAIARALISKPNLVICDEPTSALDVSVQAQILNLLQDLRKALGVNFVIISHNLAVVDYLADEVMVMNRGRIEEHAPTETIFSYPKSAYTRMLLASILSPEPEKGLPDLELDET